MKAFSRVIVGTAVALAAVLTAAPLGAGLADVILSPDHHTKRGVAPTPDAQSPAAEHGEPWSGGAPDQRWSGTDDEAEADGPAAHTPSGLDIADGVASAPRTVDAAAMQTGAPTLTLAAGAGGEAVEARITELAADLQAGVAAGEFAQADADRVLADMAGYIRGERTWPERAAV